MTARGGLALTAEASSPQPASSEVVAAEHAPGVVL